MSTPRLPISPVHGVVAVIESRGGWAKFWQDLAALHDAERTALRSMKRRGRELGWRVSREPGSCAWVAVRRADSVRVTSRQPHGLLVKMGRADAAQRRKEGAA